MQAVTVSVIGKVQGVGFRYFTCRKAKSLHLTGWVRNESDRSVSIHAEGLQDNLEAFILWVKKGPSTSYVQDTIINKTPVTGLYNDFTVRY